jgi:hypothetical protein
MFNAAAGRAIGKVSARSAPFSGQRQVTRARLRLPSPAVRGAHSTLRVAESANPADQAHQILRSRLPKVGARQVRMEHYVLLRIATRAPYKYGWGRGACVPSIQCSKSVALPSGGLHKWRRKDALHW